MAAIESMDRYISRFKGSFLTLVVFDSVPRKAPAPFPGREVEGTPYATTSPLTSPLVNARLLDLAQGAFQFGEIAGAKRLDARTVVTVKRRDGVRAASILGFLWGAEPQPKMEGVHWLELRVLLGVKVVHLRRFHDARSKREQLFAEDASGAHLTLALVVGLEVCLVPGDAKGAVRLLGDEQLELRVLGRMVDSDIHDLLVRRCGADVHVGFGPFEAFVVHGRLGAHHLEGGAVHRKGGRSRQGHNHNRHYHHGRQFPHLLEDSFLFGLHSPLLIDAFTASTKRGSSMQVCGGWVCSCSSVCP